MDEISLLVAETYRHFKQNYEMDAVLEESLEEDALEAKDVNVPEEAAEHELPTGPGVLYHIQRSTSIFVIRTLVSRNIRQDYLLVKENPENYPSLRLISEETETKLRYFMVDNEYQAEIIHDQLNNRRFPIFEERMCNLSDPGFSWWLCKKDQGFQVSFNLSANDEDRTVKLGPLGDQQLASKTFLQLGQLLQEGGLSFEIQNEVSRIQFLEGESLLVDEFQDLFEFGVMGQTLGELFKLLSRKENHSSSLETIWYYLQELAHMRRFWIQIQYDLSAETV